MNKQNKRVLPLILALLFLCSGLVEPMQAMAAEKAAASISIQSAGKTGERFKKRKNKKKKGEKNAWTEKDANFGDPSSGDSLSGIESMGEIVADRPSRMELKSTSYAIPPLVNGTFVFGGKVVVNPVWWARASTHSVCPLSVLNSPVVK